MNTLSKPPPIDPSAAPPVARFRWRVLTIAAVFICLLLPKIATGTLWQVDEIYTANRSREILVRHDPFTITLNLSRDFKKPPLQYWMGAVSQSLLPAHRELAARLPTLLYGAACLLALAWMSRCCYPDDDLSLSLCAVLALAGCGYFIHGARIALLDCGIAFHLTLALAAAQLARTDPRWWWFVALQAALGALQKMPYTLAAWVILVIVRSVREGRSVWRSRHLPAALVVGALLSASWWFLQLALHGSEPLLATARWQAHALEHPRVGTTGSAFIYLLWLVREWAIPGALAPVVVLAGMRAWQRPPAPLSLAAASAPRFDPTPELAWICAIYGLAVCYVSYRGERYLVLVTPILALLTVRWLHGLAPRIAARVPRLPPRWVVPLAVASTLPVAAFHYLVPTRQFPQVRDASRSLGRHLRPGEDVFVIFHDRANLNVPYFLLFYANLDRRVVEVYPDKTAKTLVSASRGLCHRGEWPGLQQSVPAVRQVSTHGDWIEWERS